MDAAVHVHVQPTGKTGEIRQGTSTSDTATAQRISGTTCTCRTRYAAQHTNVEMLLSPFLTVSGLKGLKRFPFHLTLPASAPARWQ